MTDFKKKMKKNREFKPTFVDSKDFSFIKGSYIKSRTPDKINPVCREFVPSRDIKDEELIDNGILNWRNEYPLSISIDSLENKIICGDSKKSLECIPSNSISCIITSPPYWNAVDYGFENQIGMCSYKKYHDELLEVWRECERVLIPNGKLCINSPVLNISKKVINNQHTRHFKNINNDIEYIILENLNLLRYSVYIWNKVNTTEKMFGSYPYPPNMYERNEIEYISVYVKPGKPRVLDKKIKENSKVSCDEWIDLTRQVWNIRSEDVKRSIHPAPFPEEIPNRLISMYSFAECEEVFKGDIILDPFCGKGTTCLSAKKLGRRFIGIDLSPHFCLVSKKRIDEIVKDRKIFIVGKSMLPSSNG
jgi:DNA modification methylase